MGLTSSDGWNAQFYNKDTFTSYDAGAILLDTERGPGLSGEPS